MLVEFVPRFKKRSGFIYVAYLGVMVFITMEISLRVFVRADASFYVAFSDLEPGKDIQYPYGFIRFNTDGYADDEFNAVKTKPRVAYFGDSVCYGVGAGHGYRVSEVLEELYPEFEHMNFTGGLDNKALELNDKIKQWIADFDLDVLVYLMTLDDIKPSGYKLLIERRSALRDFAEWFRGRCYVYTYLRQVAKNLIVRSVEPAYARFPKQQVEAYRQTAERLSLMDRDVRNLGAKLIIVVLPHEMQVSADAERVYRDKGVEWEDDYFINRGSQHQLLGFLDGPVVFDAYYAFIDPDNVDRDRSCYEVGECFVYNRGERLDWTHPNRKGHRMIAEYIRKQSVLASITTDSTSDPDRTR